MPVVKQQAQLVRVAKKHGFVSSSEYGDVAANISMVMALNLELVVRYYDKIDAVLQ
jgi:hypothetical protein